MIGGRGCAREGGRWGGGEGYVSQNKGGEVKAKMDDGRKEGKL